MKTSFVCSLLLLISLGIAAPMYGQAKAHKNQGSDDKEATQAPFEEVIFCPLGSHGEHSITIWRRLDYFESNYIYYEQTDNGLRERYGKRFESEEMEAIHIERESFLELVWLSCLKVPNSSEHIFVMNTTPPAGRHLNINATRYNSYLKRWQDLGLTSDELPLYVYLNKKEFMFIGVYSPLDRKEPDDIYTVSHYLPKKYKGYHRIEKQYKKIPDSKEFEVIPIQTQIELKGKKRP